MKRNVVFPLAIFAVLVISTSMYAQSTDELKAKIEKINSEMSSAMVSGDMSKVMTYYAPDVISMPNNSKMIEGIDALKKSNEEMAKSGSKVTMFNTKTLKVSTCGNMVTEIGTYKISFTMPGMDHPMNDEGKYITIWEKQSDGSLKIKIEIWNSDMSPMGNM